MEPAATPAVVLTIGPTDPTAASGIQADLKTFAAHELYGVSVVTAVVTHSSHGIDDVYPLPPTVVASQLAAVLEDLPVVAVKVGLLGTAEIAAVVAARARSGGLPNLVLDPVVSVPGGNRLGLTAAVKRLLPYATVVTPNADEASALLGRPVITTADMARAAGQLAGEGAKSVVVTGGSIPGDESVDAMWTPAGSRFLRAPRVPVRDPQGTGATFSASVAACLALGETTTDALTGAKDYVTRVLEGAVGWRWGRGGGTPLNHFGF